MTTVASRKSLRALPANRSPLRALLAERMAALGLDDVTLGMRLGYRNPAKARGRVRALGDGFLDNEHSRHALARLAQALVVAPAVVDDAVAATRAALREVAEEDARAEEERRRASDVAYRRTFRPHAVLETEHSTPSQIVICLLCGGPERFLRIDLDDTQPRETFAAQVLARLRERTSLTTAGARSVPFFGRVLGFFVNVTPDEVQHHDVDGRLLRHVAGAVRVGGGSLRVG